MTFSYRERLFCPGPTPIPGGISEKLSRDTYHRQQEFVNVFQQCRNKLARLAGGDEPIILCCSGTGAMEAVVVNFTTPDAQVLVINGGKFGERFVKLAEIYSCKVIDYPVPWGQSPDLQDLDRVLATSNPLTAFFIQANETSTAVSYPLPEIARLVRRHHPDCLIIVDAVSSFIAEELQITDWNLDCVVSASQKALGLPPGLAFVFLSKRAKKLLLTNDKRPCAYFDLQEELLYQDKSGPRFTPATGLILALNEVLDRLLAIGNAELVRRHQLLAKACRAALTRLELELFAKNNPSNALTSVILPSSLPARAIRDYLWQQYQLQFAGGQSKETQQMLRIAHLGFNDIFDLISALSGLELALTHFQHSFSIGSGVEAALQIFTKCQEVH